MKINDKIKVHLFDTNNKEIKTRNFDKVFTVCEENGKLGIYWTEEFAPFESFAPSVKFEIMETFRTYEQDIKELNITAEEFDNVISNIYDKTDAEMIAISKAIKSGAGVLPVVQRALERVLGMRQTERQEAYNFHYDICTKSIPCCGCANYETCTKTKK